MRVMITYYNGNEYKIADVNTDAQDMSGLLAEVEHEMPDCEDVISIVEVMSGVDYNKAMYTDMLGPQGARLMLTA